MDARMARTLHGGPGGLDVAAGAASEAADDRRLVLRPSLGGHHADLGRNRADGGMVIRRGGGEAGLNHVHAQAG